MEEDEPRIGGHDFVFVDELSPGQTCSICLLAMRSPVQTVCGHRFCESCLLETFREGRDQVCPQDRTPIPDGGFFQDVAWKRDILSLRVKCKRSDRECDWTGQLRHYEEHFNLCEYEDVTCGDCYNEMQRRLLHNHTTSECRHRIVQCEYCQEEFEFREKEYHKDNLCTRFPLDCPQECGVQEIPREEVESHVRDDCAMTMVLCPYEGAGCTFLDKRSQLNDHLEASSEEHLRKTWFKLLRTTERLNELKAVEGQIEELQTDKESMKMLLDANSEEISDLNLTAKKLEVKNMALEKDVAALQKQLEEVKLIAADDKEEVSSLKSEYKALKKEVEGLRCRKAYPVKDVSNLIPNTLTWPICESDEVVCQTSKEMEWEGADAGKVRKKPEYSARGYTISAKDRKK